MPRRIPRPVPLDARVLLLGDESVWAPAGGEAAQGCGCICGFCSVVLFGPSFAMAGLRGGGVSPAAVVAAATAFIARAIRLGWLRVTASSCLMQLPVLPSWCVIDTTFQLTQEQFQKRWCVNEACPHYPVCCRRHGAACSCAAPPPVVSGAVLDSCPVYPVCGAGQPGKP